MSFNRKLSDFFTKTTLTTGTKKNNQTNEIHSQEVTLVRKETPAINIPHPVTQGDKITTPALATSPFVGSYAGYVKEEKYKKTKGFLRNTPPMLIPHNEPFQGRPTSPSSSQFFVGSYRGEEKAKGRGILLEDALTTPRLK